MLRSFAADLAMDYLKSFPALEGLVDLANRDIDISPTLLRVLTDLYVSKPRHSLEEERQYTELVLRLIDAVDVSARYNLAQRLAHYAQTPVPVVQRLARDVIAVAEPILSHSRVLSGKTFMTIAQGVGPSHVAVVLARDDVEAKDTPAIGTAAVTAAPVVADPLARQSEPAADLNELFFACNATERRLILLNLDFAPFAPAKPIGAALTGETLLRLEGAALSHNIEMFARELARALTLSLAQARRVADDPSGEPLVAAAKTLRMPADVLQRILLCLNPAISQSVQRVYELADLYEELKVEAALRMLAIWQAASRAQMQPSKPATHQPQHLEDRVRPRPDAASSFRRPAAAAREPEPRFGKKQS